MADIVSKNITSHIVIFAALMKPFYDTLKLGILGGGQLGRMLIQKTIDFNITTYVLDGDENAPSRHICDEFTHVQFSDFDSVYNF